MNEYSPGTCTSRNSYGVPIDVPAEEESPRSNRQREGHKEENCSGKQERAKGLHTCESEVHWLWKTWRDKYKHRVIMARTYWCEFRQLLEKASAVVQPDVFPYQGKHSFPLPSLQVMREHMLPSFSLWKTLLVPVEGMVMHQTASHNPRYQLVKHAWGLSHCLPLCLLLQVVIPLMAEI